MNQTEAFKTLFAKLDSYQRAVAALNPATNVRVLAGAGAGKTTTLVAWVARLLHEGVFKPGEVIVTTFTRKASEELVSRLSTVVPAGALDPEGKRAGTLRVGTFHSLALRSLRQADAQKWNMSRCMDVDSRGAGIPATGLLWSRICGWAGKDGLPGTGAPGLDLEDVDARSYALAVEVCRSTGETGPALSALIRDAEREQGLRYLLAAWQRFEESKQATGAWDFSDALTAWLTGLEAGTLTDGARLVIVDEAQDNDQRMLRIAQALTRKGVLALVGDVRQSIYGWRGAFPDMLAEADTRIHATTLVMPTNYRSVSKVVAAGNAVAAGQKWDVGAPAVPARAEEGLVTLTGSDTPAEEASRFAEEIATSVAGGRAYSDHAILVRTNALAGVAEAALVASQIPCVVVGGTPFFARKDVKDVLAYVSLSWGDDDEALARIVNRPKRFLGAAFVEAVKRAPGDDLLARIDAASGNLRGSSQRGAARSLAAFLGKLRKAEWHEAVDQIATLLRPQQAEGGGEADDDKTGILAAVVAVAKRFKDCTAFLDFAHRCANEVKQSSEGEVPAGRVVISTLHKAKGLEWPVVFLSASDGVFPHVRCDTEKRLAEERRLYYVGVTRARDVLHLTWADENLYGQDAGPSEFHGLVVQIAEERQAEPKVKAVPPTVRKAKPGADAVLDAKVAFAKRAGQHYCPACESEIVIGPCEHGIVGSKQ